MTFGRFFSIFAVAVLATVAFAPATWADTASLGASNDTWIRDGFSHASNGTDGVLDARLTFVPYIQFDMSTLNISSISDATLTLWKVASARNDTIVNGRFATYGLTDTPTNALQYWDELADFDPGDATNGLDFRNTGIEWSATYSGPIAGNEGNPNIQSGGVDRSVLTSLDLDDGANVTESVNNTTGEIVLSGPDLVSFLNSRASDDGLVTFLLPVEADGGRGWGIASKENANSSLHPQLDLVFTSVPEPSSIAMLALASLALIGSRQRKA